MKVKAISLWQPWASLIAAGVKVHETRSWKTDYRGPILICAAKKYNDEIDDYIFSFSSYLKDYRPEDDPREQLPFGAVVCLADLVDCRATPGGLRQNREAMPASELDYEMGDWSPGRYAWRLENIRLPKEPMPITGRQGLWDVEINPEDFQP